MIKYKTKEAALAAAEVQRVRISDWLGGHAQQERKVSVSVSDNDTFITLSVSSSTESPCGTSHQVARMMVDYIASHDDAPQEWSMWANNGRVMSISNHYYFESDEKVSA